MIEIKDKEIKIEQKDAEKTAAYSKIGTTYSFGTMKFKVNKLAGKAWRLVYDGSKVITLINGTNKDVTTSIHIVVEYENEALALEAIEKLGLELERDTLVYEDTKK